MCKVFSCERNQCWFEKQLRGRGERQALSQEKQNLNRTQNLIYSSRKIGVTQVKLVNEQSSEELVGLF